MVHALEMSVVAAGIETSMIAARAVTMGVDALQGYQLAAPMPAAGSAPSRPTSSPSRPSRRHPTGTPGDPG